jgi:hypothetical protein
MPSVVLACYKYSRPFSENVNHRLCKYFLAACCALAGVTHDKRYSKAPVESARATKAIDMPNNYTHVLMSNSSTEEIKTTQNHCYHFSLALVIKKEKLIENEQKSSRGVCYKFRLSSCKASVIL